MKEGIEKINSVPSQESNPESTGETFDVETYEKGTQEHHEAQRQIESESQQKDLEYPEQTKKNLGPEMAERTRQFIMNEKYGIREKEESAPETSGLMEKASKTLSRDDFLYFGKTLKERGEVFNPKGMVMHTTNDYNFERILSTGSIRTDEKQEGIYGTRGASFTDGDFEMALTFQTVFDDQNTQSLDKKFNSERYSDKTREFIGHFWDKKQEETKQYLSKIGSGKKVDTIDDAIKIAESFKFKAKPKEIADDPERLSRLFGVTIVYDKEKLPDLTTEGTEGLQKDFELRSYREGGVPIKDASIIFVPEARMDEIGSLLKENGLDNIEIRPSEELEIARMAKLLEKK